MLWMRGRTCITIWNCMRKCKKGMVLGALNPLFWRPKCVFGAIEMPRANRYFLPGYVWHITHRCHKREFLMKFSRDQHRWLQWLYEAKKRFGISILNYGVTSVVSQRYWNNFSWLEKSASFSSALIWENICNNGVFSKRDTLKICNMV